MLLSVRSGYWLTPTINNFHVSAFKNRSKKFFPSHFLFNFWWAVPFYVSPFFKLLWYSIVIWFIVKLLKLFFFRDCFQMNAAEEIVNLIFYFAYFMTLSTEIFLPCYFGTEIMLKNAQLTTAIYSSSWIGFPIYLQKMIAIFMGFTKTPRYMVAGKLFNLSLANFLLVSEPF